MTWLPRDFFIGQPGALELRPNRPLSQGDVVDGALVAGRAKLIDGQRHAKVTSERVLVVSSSCGMRKSAGAINDLIQVAPIKRLESLARGWTEPWDGWLHVLPLPGITDADEGAPQGADLSRIGVCGSDQLAMENRIASVTLHGLTALKSRVATYFVRAPVPTNVLEVGSLKEWHEVDLWELWTERTGAEDGFQEWLDQENLSYLGQSRRDTLYGDLEGIREQLILTASSMHGD